MWPFFFKITWNPIPNPLTATELEALKWKLSNLIICGMGRTLKNPANHFQDHLESLDRKCVNQTSQWKTHPYHFHLSQWLWEVCELLAVIFAHGHFFVEIFWANHLIHKCQVPINAKYSNQQDNYCDCAIFLQLYYWSPKSSTKITHDMIQAEPDLTPYSDRWTTPVNFQSWCVSWITS